MTLAILFFSLFTMQNQTSFSFIKENINTVLMEMTEDFGHEFDEPIESDITFVKDLGFTSIDFVQLAVAVEQKFNTKIGFQGLFMQNGKYVEDITLGELIHYTHSKLNTIADTEKDTQPVAKAPQKNAQTFVHDKDKVTEQDFEIFKAMLYPRRRSVDRDGSKNPPIAFILSPPRSGSTLLRVMLAGNPSLFSPPELHLLPYDKMDERKDALQKKDNEHLLEGTVHALMQLRGIDADTARQYIVGCEQESMPTKTFYHRLQNELKNKLLIDKTPTYAMHENLLQYAETNFETPFYIHLLRHPCGMIRSYEESKLSRLMPFMKDSAFSSRKLAEMTWLLSNKNTLSFSQKIPKERWITVHYEDILLSPQAEIQRLCDFLKVDFHPDMVNPYKDTEQRMTSGVDTPSRMSGDLKFHLHKEIDPDSATRWQQFYSEDILGVITSELASNLGY